MMRNYIDIVTEHALLEAGAGASRIVAHIKNGKPFFMISAHRADKTHEENLKRGEVLKKHLAQMPGVSFIETESEFQEAGQDEPSKEDSFFVLQRSEKTDPKKFIALGSKLMNIFDQDAILAGDGDMVYMIDKGGERQELGDVLTFDPNVIATLPGHSSVKGHKFSFTTPDNASNGTQYAIPDAPEDKWGLDYSKIRDIKSA